MFEKLERIFLPMANKLAENKYLTAIREGFVAILPLMIIGSFFILINSVVIGENGITNKLFGQEFSTLLIYGNAVLPATMSILAILLTFTTAKKMCSIEGIDDTIIPSLAVTNFFIFVPAQFNTEESFEFFNTMYTSSAALFLAFIVAISTVLIIKKLMSFEKIKIKMPDGVPTGVTRSFNLLIPILITILLFATVRLFAQLAGTTVNDVIFAVIQTPFTTIVNSHIGLTIIYSLYMLLWGLGIHTAFIFNPILEPIYLTGLDANLASFQSGTDMSFIITKPFIDSVAFMGGAGNMIALLIAIFFVSKREDYRRVAQIGFVPSLFNISEPVMFGLPVVMNPILIIPMVVSTLFGLFIGVISTLIGFMGHTYILTPWTTPPLINPFLATGGDLKSVLVCLIILIGSVFIYIPFVMIMNKQVNKEIA